MKHRVTAINERADPVKKNLESSVDTIAQLLESTQLSERQKIHTVLRTEEGKHSFRHKRLRSNYRDNYTAALQLPYAVNALVYKRQSTLLELSKNNIIEHAARRVDLFFLTLIAYYGKNLTPTSGHTTLQHGRGRTLRWYGNVTQACHSSLTPALIDETIFQSRSHKNIFWGTYFENNLNSTIELPPFVNQFDDLLEKVCRDKALEILCDVSMSKINPIEGLNQFLKLMALVLDDFKLHAEEQKHSSLLSNSFMKKHTINASLVALVYQGTLECTYSCSTQSVSEQYIHLMLGLTAEEKMLDVHAKETLYGEKIRGIQGEILSTKSRIQANLTEQQFWF